MDERGDGMRHGRPHIWVTPRKGDRLLKCSSCGWFIHVASELGPDMRRMVKEDVIAVRGESGYRRFSVSLLSVEGVTA